MSEGISLFWTSMISLAIFLILLTTVLCQLSEKFKYKFKFCFYVFYVSSITLLSIPYCLLRPKSVENTMHITPIVSTASKLLGVKWEILGTHILEGEEPFVVICNHQSIIDALGLAHVWPLMRRCAAVAKKELLYIFPFGLAAWLCGTVFIDRASGTESRNKLSKTANSIKEDKKKLWIFPEGTRHKGDSLLPFKKGAFHLAVQNQLPIVPVVISPYTFIDDSAPYFRSGKVIMSVLDPVPTTNTTDINELVEKCRNMMNAEYLRLSELVNINVKKSIPNGSSKKTNGVAAGNSAKSSRDNITFGEAKKLL